FSFMELSHARVMLMCKRSDQKRERFVLGSLCQHSYSLCYLCDLIGHHLALPHPTPLCLLPSLLPKLSCISFCFVLWLRSNISKSREGKKCQTGKLVQIFSGLTLRQNSVTSSLSYYKLRSSVSCYSRTRVKSFNIFINNTLISLLHPLSTLLSVDPCIPLHSMLPVVLRLIQMFLSVCRPKQLCRETLSFQSPTSPLDSPSTTRSGPVSRLFSHTGQSDTKFPLPTLLNEPY
ncbi:hypothetical protein GOODEAATRI_001446, partial [Goodea atripinnis]